MALRPRVSQVLLMTNHDEFADVNVQHVNPAPSHRSESPQATLRGRERRNPENASIRRWINLGDKVLGEGETARKTDPKAA